MTNTDKLAEQIGEALEKEFNNNIKKLEKLLQKDYSKTKLQEAIQNAINSAVLLQKNKEKGSIKYISISMLLSSIICEKYSFAINLYDENFYLDEVEVFSQWYLEEMVSLVDSDLTEIEKYLRRKQIPFLKRDLIEIKKAQAIVYMATYIGWLKEHIVAVANNLNTKDLICSEQVEITFGLYLESHEKIYSLEVSK